MVLAVVILLSFSLQTVPAFAKKTTDAHASSTVFHLDLNGEYDGYSGWSIVRRNLEIHLTSANAKGAVRGRAIISPSSKADSALGANGSYYIRGSLNRNSGHIELQGYKWIDYPISKSTGTWDFVTLEGTYDDSTGSIAGTSDYGIWKMSAIRFKNRCDTSGFKLGSDNNSFVHTSSALSPYAGFAGVKDYSISQQYFDGLVSGCTEGEVSAIKRQATSSWEGSCYGIAATMGLCYEGKLSVPTLSKCKASRYNALPLPCKDSRLLNVINYYQLSQTLSQGGKDSAIIARAYGRDTFKKLEDWLVKDDSLSVFLQALVKQASSKHVSLLGYSYSTKEKTEGHAVLATGCSYDKKNKRYDVKIYDENSVASTSPSGAFGHFYVNNDYSAFTYRDANGKTVIRSSSFNDTFDQVYLLDWNRLIGPPSQLSGAKKSNKEPGWSAHSHLSFSKGKAATVENSSGDQIIYDGKKFSGDMRIYNLDVTSERARTTYDFEVPSSESYTLHSKGKQTSITTRNSTGYLAVSGRGITGAELSFSDGIAIEGKAYSFDTAISTPGKISKNETGLAGFSGKATKPVAITAKGTTASMASSATISGLSIATYKGSEVATTEARKPTRKLRVSAGRKIIGSASISLSRKSFAYNGKVRKPKVTIRTGSKTLRPSKDYSVAYRNNRKAGIASVVVSGRGSWNGSKTIYFSIRPKSASIKNLVFGNKRLRIRWKRQRTQTSGYQIRLSKQKNMAHAMLKTVASPAARSATIKRPLRTEKKKALYVQIRTYKKSVNGYSFSKWSERKAVTVK